MAFEIKYQTQFTDNESQNWKIDILKDGFAGDISIMQAYGGPLAFSWPSLSEDPHEQNIRGTRVGISIISDTDFQYSELFTADNLEFKVNIYYGSTLFWTGWIAPNVWSEPYVGTPYAVTISAVDGLGLLKDFDFSELSLSDRQTNSKLIYDILGEIGFTSFTEYVNVYESTMSSGVGDSPLDQSGTDTELFEDKTLYEALKTILKTFNACIIQHMGEMIIYRYKELEDATMYGRTFTSATAKTATTNTPLQYIKRPLQTSNLVDEGNGVLTIKPIVSDLLIHQDYHARDSILKTWEFNYEDFSGSGSSWDVSDWTETSTPDPRPIGNNSLYRGSDPGVYLHSVRAAAGATGANINQSIDVLTSVTDGFVVNFEWNIINNSPGSLTGRVEAEITIVESGTTYYFDGTQWTTSSTRIPTTGGIHTVAVNDSTGWTTFNASIDGSKTGPLTIKLFAVVETSSTASFYTAYKNIQIQYTNSDGIIAEGIDYTVNNAVNGRIVELEYDLGDGDGLDNVLVMEKGALNVYSGADEVATSSSWSTRGGSEADPIIELIGGEIGNQFSRPTHLLDITLYEQNNEFLNLIGNFQDVLNQYSGSNRKFIVNQANYDVKMRKWDLGLHELI